MSNDYRPTISALIAAYQSERWIAEALDSILAQTCPADEVIVVDDGSTDGTSAVLDRYAGHIRVIRQPNGGCPAAFNTAIRAATADYVALCGSDDVWEPRKLEWQSEAIRADPELDVLFGHAAVTGNTDGELYKRPPGEGLLDRAAFTDALYRENFVCAPSVVIRRSLFERLGPFVENFCADDYEYWFRVLRAGGHFYYDPRPLLSYRRHDGNLTRRRLWMEECTYMTHQCHRDLVGRESLVNEVLSDDLFRIARHLVDEDRRIEARHAFVQSLRYRPRGRALAWALVLSAPDRLQRALGDRLVSAKRRLRLAPAGRTAT
jgi:glycosyltransferase involved in cell wall biosynthesis